MDLKRGFVKVIPENLDDLWHLYNIISQRDGVYAKTTREVKVEGERIRPTKGRRIPVSLGIIVENVSFDKSTNRLRVTGVVVEAPEDLEVKGTHHTINVTVGIPVTISKVEWLDDQIKRLRMAAEYRGPPILVIALDDENCCAALLRQYGFDVKMDLRVRLPGKLEAERREEGMLDYFRTCMRGLAAIWMEAKSPVVIVGPSFVKDEFAKYVKDSRADLAKNIVAVKNVSVGGIAGIHEALRCGILTHVAKHVRMAEEAVKVEGLLAKIGGDGKDVVYGLSEVEQAVNYGAVSLLLVGDRVLRESRSEERMRLEGIMKSVEKMRGEIMVISGEHEAGEKLLSLGGIAAFLRFPLG